MNLQIFQGNWIDLLIIVILALYVWDRYKKGFIYELIDLFGFLLSLIIALRFYSFASFIFQHQFHVSRGISNALGFLLIAFLTELICAFIAGFIDRKISKNILHSPLNRRLSFIPALLSGIVLVAFILTTLVTLPIKPAVKQDIVNSKIGGFLVHRTIGSEKTLGDVFGGAIQDSLGFLTVKPQGTESVDINFKTTDVTPDLEAEEKMFQLVNQERSSRGLKTLSPNAELLKVARAHCTDMFARGYFSHYTPDGLSPFDRMQKAGIEYQAAGENLAFAPTVEIAHQGLMDSPGHKANILSINFGKVGIGVISAGIYGKMFCQEFTD